MNVDEAEAVLRMLAAAWPSPQMTDDEAARWAVRCLDVTFDECAGALLELERTSRHRPSWADTYALIRQARERAVQPTRALDAPPNTYRDVGKRNIAHLQQMLKDVGRNDELLGPRRKAR